LDMAWAAHPYANANKLCFNNSDRALRMKLGESVTTATIRWSCHCCAASPPFCVKSSTMAEIFATSVSLDSRKPSIRKAFTKKGSGAPNETVKTWPPAGSVQLSN
jgi:hypothetical protein